MHEVWDSQRIIVPTKTAPSSEATRSHPGKANIYETKALNETMLLMRRKKCLTIPLWTLPIPTPNFNQRERMGRMRKRRKKFKRKQISEIKLN